MLLDTGRVVGVLVLAVTMMAQAPVDRDAISGNWGSDSARLLELKFDGKQTVTGAVFLVQGGTQRASAPIKTGSYDLRSRLLKLAGEMTFPDGQSRPYTIEGTLENDVLDVAYTFGNDAGRMTLKKL